MGPSATGGGDVPSHSADLEVTKTQTSSFWQQLQFGPKTRDASEVPVSRADNREKSIIPPFAGASEAADWVRLQPS